MVTSEGFVVLKGAVVNEKTSAKSLSAGMKKLRDRIFADGRVENMTTTEDILFSSSSAAADFVLGYSASGPRTWKAKDGRTLKEIEDNATVDNPFNFAIPFNCSKIRTPQGLHPTVRLGLKRQKSVAE